MKKSLTAALCIVAMLGLAVAVRADDEEENIMRVSMASNGKTVALSPGAFLEVRLDANPKAGMRWHLTSQNDPVLRKEGDPKYKESETKTPGTTGTQTFRFKADEPGSTLLTLVYRSKVISDEDKPQEFTLSVDVR